MKKVTLAVLLTLAIAAAFALTARSQEVLTGPMTPQATNVLLSAVSAPGSGATIDLLQTADKFSCTIVWSGTTPVNTVTALMGSIDGVNFVPLQTQTSISSPDYFSVVFKPVRWIMGSYISSSGGDATTAVTMTCAAGGLSW